MKENWHAWWTPADDGMLGCDLYSCLDDWAYEVEHRGMAKLPRH